jgi:hypothetical protein
MTDRELMKSVECARIGVWKGDPGIPKKLYIPGGVLAAFVCPVVKVSQLYAQD